MDWERLELDDGDFLELAWSGPPDGPIVLFFHGLEGGIRSHYATGIMHGLGRHGFRVCLMHFRGCGTEPNRLPISYHSGKTDDPQRLLEHVQQEFGRPPFAAIGVSLGGNVLLKWLGEMGGQCPLRRAAVMSVPFVLNDAALRLSRGMSRIYERYLVSSLQRSFRRKFAHMPCPLEVDVDRLNTFRRFDDQVTAKLHGFNDVDDYYTQASSRQYVPRIRIPTLILHAADDPFMYPDTAPAASELPPQVTLELTAHGGHVGFIGGRWPGLADYWGERRLAEWMVA